MSKKNKSNYFQTDGGDWTAYLDRGDSYEKKGSTTYYSGGHHSTSHGHVHDKHEHGRCYHKHPALKLPGTGLVIYGGSCHNPVVLDADVYIGFDAGMHRTKRSMPWHKGEEVQFAVTDMSAPSDPAEFKLLVEWTKLQLEAGKKVHAGCIGGHGRTGMFFAALVSAFGEPDAIAYVRKNYCEKAVESASQVKFLNTHFGVVAAKGHKEGISHSTGKGLSSKGSGTVKYLPPPSNTEQFSPIRKRGCLWGD